MEWISSVDATRGEYSLRTIDTMHKEHLRSISELKSMLASNGKLAKVRGNISFADWRELNAGETDALAEELGFPPRRNGQAFYRFEAENKRYIIPAGTLMCAMFRPFHGIAKYLLAPQGLENLCVPYHNCEKPELLFFTYPRTATGMQVEKAEGILNSLSWMHCFPSARQMWGSVREYASQGQLGLKLPIGIVQYAGSGEPLASRDFLIRDFRIQLLKTEEEPFTQFSLHTKAIEFERILHKLKVIRKYPKDLSIPLRDGDWTLTDEEWAVIRDIVVRKSRAGHLANVRNLVNLQLEKLSQGLPWATVAPNIAEQTNCRKFFRKMESDGRWGNLTTRLRELRNTP